MSTASRDQFLSGTAEAARRAGESYTKRLNMGGSASKHRRAKIQTVNSNGTYEIGLLGNDGSITDTIDGVETWEDGILLLIDQRVWAVWEGDSPIPYIQSSSGDLYNASAEGCLTTFSN